MQKQLKKLKEERQEITNQINVIYHKMFADYLNNELKLIDYKDKMYYVDTNSKHYCSFPSSVVEKILKWFQRNDIELREYNFNGIIIEIFNSHYPSGRIILENKSRANNFIKTFEVVCE